MYMLFLYSNEKVDLPYVLVFTCFGTVFLRVFHNEKYKTVPYHKRSLTLDLGQECYHRRGMWTIKARAELVDLANKPG